MIFRVKLTPVGHYFLGGERTFSYDKELSRIASDSYFIKSLKVPSQTTLFGCLRYMIGVKDNKLRDNSKTLIGEKTYDISQEQQFGIIKNISPLYLYRETSDGKCDYYIRTPFDHKKDEIKEGQTKNSENKEAIVYHPLELGKSVSVISFPGKKAVKKNYPSNYVAKEGLEKSYMSVNTLEIVEEDRIFIPSVEVVSKKNHINPDNRDGYAKKEYYRLYKGWSFVFFADLNTDSIPEYNNSVILGKDSSIFCAEMTKGQEEPDVSGIFKNRTNDFHYCQSAVYIKRGTSEIIGNSDLSIIESDTIRKFQSNGSKLRAVNAPLIQMIKAGSIIYMDDVERFANDQACVAGFNRVISGGNDK